MGGLAARRCRAISDDRVAGRREHPRHDLRRLRLRIADTVAQGVSVEQGRIAEHDRFRKAPARARSKPSRSSRAASSRRRRSDRLRPQHVRRGLVVGGHNASASGGPNHSINLSTSHRGCEWITARYCRLRPRSRNGRGDRLAQRIAQNAVDEARRGVAGTFARQRDGSIDGGMMGMRLRMREAGTAPSAAPQAPSGAMRIERA